MRYLLIFTTFVVLSSCGKSTRINNYILDAREQEVYQYLIKSEYNCLINPECKSLIQRDGNLIILSAANTAFRFQINEIDADKNLKNKLIYVFGIVDSDAFKSVRDSVESGKQPRISMSGEALKPYWSPFDFRKNEDAGKLLLLSRRGYGFVCTCNGAVLGSPIYSDCLFPYDFVEEFYSKNLILKFLAVYLNQSPKEVLDACVDKDTCIKSMSSYLNDAGIKRAAMRMGMAEDELMKLKKHLEN